VADRALSLEEAVIGAFAGIDAVPETERILEAHLGRYAATVDMVGSSFYWVIRAQHEYGSSEHLYKVTDAAPRKKDAKAQILRDMAKYQPVSRDVDPDDELDEEDDKQQGSEA
jgi:hypothetical protein